MKDSRTSAYFLGIVFIFVGIGILFNNLNIFHFNIGRFIVPVVILYFGFKLYDRGRRTSGGVLLLIGIALMFGAFGIFAGNMVGIVFAIAIMYFGYRMIRSKRKEIEVPPTAMHADPLHEEMPESEGDKRGEFHDRTFKNFQRTYSKHSSRTKHSLIGNLYLTGPRWELEDMHIWHGIGDVKIDLSRAFIHEGETILVINGWIGDIDVFVPYDLEIALSAHVYIGDIKAFGNEDGGINRSVSLETSGFREAKKRVRMIIHLIVGDVDVMYV